MNQFITFNGKKIHFKVLGKGKTIVFLHGFMETLNIWNDFSRELSKYFNIVTIDLPGHGKSECIQKVHSMELMSDIVKSVLDHLNIKKCMMVGHSMGGYVTLAFAKKHSELLKGFALFHSQALADTPDVKKNRNRTIEIVKKNHTDFINQFIPSLFAPENIKRFCKEIDVLKQKAGYITKESIIAALEGMKQRTEKLDVLINTTIPILFIFGKKDTRISYEEIFTQTVLPDHSEILILGNVGHMGHIEAKQQTLQTIKYFVEKIETNIAHISKTSKKREQINV